MFKTLHILLNNFFDKVSRYSKMKGVTEMQWDYYNLCAFWFYIWKEWVKWKTIKQDFRATFPSAFPCLDTSDFLWYSLSICKTRTVFLPREFSSAKLILRDACFSWKSANLIIQHTAQNRKHVIENKEMIFLLITEEINIYINHGLKVNLQVSKIPYFPVSTKVHSF